MNVTVRLYAGLRELVGAKDVALELNDGDTVAQLRDRLIAQYPVVTPYIPTLVFAVDEEYVEQEHPLREGDDVALIPPVSGGAGAELFGVTKDALDPQRLVESVRSDACGAVALFHGVARNETDGRRVRALEYDAYPEMAERKLREVADEVRTRWPVARIGIMHRVGTLAIGETSLLVAVATPHRREAFAACEHAVERVKQIVPIWKKEIWEDGDGDGAWVTGHPVSAADAGRAR